MSLADDLLSRAAQGHLTVNDLPTDVENVRIELIDGSLYVTPLADVEHQAIASRYVVDLTRLVPPGLLVLGGVNVIVGDQTLVEPDVAVIDPRLLAHNGLGVSPDGLHLAIEITSTSTRKRDLTLKRELYRDWGVPCLIVDRITSPPTLIKDGDFPVYAEALLAET